MKTFYAPMKGFEDILEEVVVYKEKNALGASMALS